ncbi:YceD family protein [Asticcacaulis machinosus]|uniref:DUF177 domain-containing protein n=1 Tax=Asticcacaulis machinosus TaxID=2984211 RepID=A0ABT5HEY8_9CAUL|nr:DUF177 domain-containing protein [Asticcacaulis machinosus]MDC7674763.1 DUF177 domain-containing protein [Asticcacaulis machinosus]
MSNSPHVDDLLWTHPVAFDKAFKGLDITLEADELLRARLKEAFGMIDLVNIKAQVKTQGKPVHGRGDIVHVSVDLTAEVTQECGVTLEPFTHTVSAAVEVDCIEAPASAPGVTPAGEHELSVQDLDEPDVVENGRIDLGLYIIEALGEAYDPFARKPGAVFEEPVAQAEPSPFAVLSKLKLD